MAKMATQSSIEQTMAGPNHNENCSTIPLVEVFTMHLPTDALIQHHGPASPKESYKNGTQTKSKGKQVEKKINPISKR